MFKIYFRKKKRLSKRYVPLLQFFPLSGLILVLCDHGWPQFELRQQFVIEVGFEFLEDEEEYSPPLHQLDKSTQARLVLPVSLKVLSQHFYP